MTAVHTAPDRAGLRRERRIADLTVWLLAAASALAAALGASTVLTGWPILDAIYRAGYGAAVAIVAASARRGTWVVLAGAALLVSVGQPAAFVVGVATLALAVGANWFRRRHRRMGALIGAVSAQLLLHGGDLGLHGLTAVVALAAPVPCAVSAWRLLPPSTRSRARKIGSWAALGLLVVVGGGLVALTQALPEARRGAERVRAGVTSLNQGDVEEAERELDRATAAFARSRDAVTSVLTIPARVLPLANPHLDAIEQVATAGADLTATAADAARDTDYGALAVTDGRIDLDRFDELRPALEQVQSALTDADANLAEIDVTSLVVPAADAVTELRTKIADTIPTVGHAIRGTELAPGMLGADGRRRWIIGFTSPAEARGLGGFLGYYSVIEAVDGEVDIVASGRVPDLNRADGEPDRTLVGPDDYLLRYGRLHPEDQLQDVTLSPDFPSVATVFESQYEQSTGETADGMIVLDPYALAELLRITGPVTVDGVQLDESNAAEFLLRTQYAAYDDREVRGDVLDEVARTAFDRLLTNRLNDPARLVRLMAPMAAQRRVMAHSTDPAEQAFFESIGLSGTFPPATSGLDLLAVTNQNAGNNKIDAYLRREIRYEPQIDPATGTVTATVRVTLYNDAPVDTLPDYVIFNREDSGQPFGVNWTWLSVHTPLVLDTVTVGGTPMPAEPQREFGWNVYALNVAVPPGPQGTEITFSLRGGLDLDGAYRFRYQTQPLVHPDVLTVVPTVPTEWAPLEPAIVDATTVEPLDVRWELVPR